MYFICQCQRDYIMLHLWLVLVTFFLCTKQCISKINIACFFALKDAACILTYAQGSSLCQPWENYVFRGEALSSSTLMHYILEDSKGRNLAWSWSLGLGSLSCRSHLIMANLKVVFFFFFFFSSNLSLFRKWKRGLLCACMSHGFKWYHFTSFLGCFVWSKWEFWESGAACEGAVRNWDWRCHLIALKLCGVVVPVSLFGD